MNAEVALDTSGILALLDNEAGADLVRSVLIDSVISTVNLAEAYSILTFRGKDGPMALKEIVLGAREVIPFTEGQAEIAGALRSITQSLGLSLGGRACLALAIDRGVPAYTADKAWATLELPCQVRLIR